MQLMHGFFLEKLESVKESRYPTDWACDAGIVCCETPSRDR
jgi:hypothetical protein